MTQLPKRYPFPDAHFDAPHVTAGYRPKQVFFQHLAVVVSASALVWSPVVWVISRLPAPRLIKVVAGLVTARVALGLLFIRVGQLAEAVGSGDMLNSLTLSSEEALLRARTEHAAAQAAIEGGDFVLVLRGFLQDANVLGTSPGVRHLGFHGGLQSTEIAVQRALHPTPVVALGNVREIDRRTSTDRRLRLYASADEWQPTVADLISRAAGVVVLMSTDVTSGLRWEIDTVMSLGTSERTLLVHWDERSLRQSQWPFRLQCTHDSIADGLAALRSATH